MTNSEGLKQILGNPEGYGKHKIKNSRETDLINPSFIFVPIIFALVSENSLLHRFPMAWVQSFLTMILVNYRIQKQFIDHAIHVGRLNYQRNQSYSIYCLFRPHVMYNQASEANLM